MQLWLALDLVVLLVFLISISYSYRRGFMKSSYTIMTLIATIVLVFLFRAPFESFVRQTPIGTSIEEHITLSIGNTATENSSGTEILPKFLQSHIQKQTEAATGLVNSASETVADAIISVIAVVVLFILVRIVLFIVLRILDKVFRLPVLRIFNKTGGILIGILNAFLVLYVLSALAFLFIPAEKLTLLQVAMEKTYLAHYFYDKNILMELFI